jgi:uncharacterized protein YndB with AHSA1/START domain
MTEPVLRVSRDYDFPPETVFDAWVDPATARKFLFTTEDGDVVRCDIDPRPGGRFTITDRRPDTGDIDHVGEYLEVDRPRRLVFTFGVPKYSPDMTTVTLDIAPKGSGCTLTLTHHGVPPEWREQTVEGWGMILAGLAKTLR